MSERIAEIKGKMIQYAESRDFSDARSQMEENGAIPSMESHPLFYAQANFNDDESIYSENPILKGGLFIYSLTDFDSRVTFAENWSALSGEWNSN